MKPIPNLKFCLFSAMLLIECSALAYDVKIDGIFYNLNKDSFTASVTYGNSGLPSYSGEVEIPSDITIENNKYTVESIGSGAFSGQINLTSVTIPQTINKIASSAFSGCRGLTSISIPNSVIAIEDDAFFECSGLKDMIIGSGVKTIGTDAFKSCTGLISIIVDNGNNYFDTRDNCNAIIDTRSNSLIVGCSTTKIPNSVNSIGNSAFFGCTNLINIDIPNSVTSICDYAFYGCKQLTGVNIPNSVSFIGQRAFHGCKNLTTITIDKDNIVYDSRENCNAIIETATNSLIIGCNSTIIPISVTSIHEYAFYGSDLDKIIIPNSITLIPNHTFEECRNLRSITLPNSITEIGDFAFDNCRNLTDLNIPDSVTLIGDFAFNGCNGLTSIIIPNSVAYIGKYAFNACYGLERITISNLLSTIEPYTFGSCSSLTSIIIPNSVSIIQDSAFWDCSGLTNLSLPNSLISIGNYAFERCTKIKSIEIPKSVKKIGRYALCGDDTMSIYVKWDMPTDNTLSISPQMLSNNMIYRNGNLFVPFGTKDLYEEIFPWSNFHNIYEYEPSGVGEIEDNGGTTISIKGGKIEISGADDTKVEVFSTNGDAIYSGIADTMPNLSAGIYIIRVGTKVQKVVIF